MGVNGFFTGVKPDGEDPAEIVASQSEEWAGESGGLGVLEMGLVAFLFIGASRGCFWTALIDGLRGERLEPLVIGEDDSATGKGGSTALDQRRTGGFVDWFEAALIGCLRGEIPGCSITAEDGSSTEIGTPAALDRRWAWGSRSTDFLAMMKKRNV